MSRSKPIWSRGTPIPLPVGCCVAWGERPALLGLGLVVTQGEEAPRREDTTDQLKAMVRLGEWDSGTSFFCPRP